VPLQRPFVISVVKDSTKPFNIRGLDAVPPYEGCG
jgi:hypothetical protein